MAKISKNALVTGITGQDGAYLAQFLLNKGYEVFGLFRRTSSLNFWRIQCLGISDRVSLIPGDVSDAASIVEAVKISVPDEIYHLAAQSHVGASFEQPKGTTDINGIGVTRFLEAIRNINPKIKFYQASTSELYGNGRIEAYNEDTSFCPASPYAAAKLYGYWMTRIYRESYGLFCCNGILFNHESPLRGLDFVTRKISNQVARIKLGLDDSLKIGNIDTKRDWGYAPEYVEAMWLMLQQDKPDDYVIASNEAHSVREFIEHAFDAVGLDCKRYMKIDKSLIRPLDVNYLQGDNKKASLKLGWKCKTKFDELVKIMVTEDLTRWRRYMNGEHFPWDAPNHTENLRILTRVLRR
ncbi:MAG: GDP-mannose 4,6-dehydratase [Candidatus Poribacteria bacterium]